MLKKIRQPIFFMIIATATVIWQWSFINSLPDFFSYFNLVLTVLVLTVFFFDFRSAAFFALAAGFWLDIMAFNFFGLYLIVVLTVALVAERLLSSWLTNRSFYSFLALLLLSTGFYNFLVFGLLNISEQDAGIFFLFRSSFWHSLGYQAIWNFIGALFLFNLANRITPRLKPFFLSDN